MKTKAVTGIVLTMLFLVVVSPIGVSVRVVDFESESEDFVAQSSVDWWPMFHHDPSHTGYSTSTAPNTNNTSWTYTTGFVVESSPAVADGKVYIGSYDQKFYCLNATTGAFIWSCTIGYVRGSSAAVVDGRVYVGSAAPAPSKVCCLNATTGAYIWSYEPGLWVISSPAVVDGRVYVGSLNNKVYCLNATTGAYIWSYTTGADVWSSPAVVDGRVYVGSRDNKTYCLNAATGKHIWSYTTGDGVRSSPAVADGKVYVGSADNNVYCLNASASSMTPDEREIWSYTTGSHVYSSPAVVDGRVYVGSGFPDNKTYCLNATTGKHIWSYTTGDGVQSSPAVADGKVYVGSQDNSVYCLNATTGAYIWSYTTGSYVQYSSPAVADGRVYVGSADNKVYAFGPHDVTIQAYCGSEGTAVSVSITMDGSPTGYNTSHTFTDLTGTNTFTVPDTDPSGHPFKQWSTGETHRTITVTAGGTYTAYYGTHYNLIITTTIGGTTNPSPGTYTYCNGTMVSVTAIPEPKGVFRHWELDGSWYSDSSLTSVTMDSNHTLHAVFKFFKPSTAGSAGRAKLV